MIAALVGRRVWFLKVSDTREVTMQQTVGLSGPVAFAGPVEGGVALFDGHLVRFVLDPPEGQTSPEAWAAGAGPRANKPRGFKGRPALGGWGWGRPSPTCCL